MKLDEIKIGEKYTYYPIKQTVDDNRHFPAVVEKIAKRVRIRVFMDGAVEGVLLSVSARSLSDQCELL